MVDVQWSAVGALGFSDSRRLPHTACRVVNEEEAVYMNMDVDLVFGTDCKKGWILQDFVVGARRPLERLAGVMEGEGTMR